MEQLRLYLSLGILVGMGLITFFAMGIDKRRARKHAWRIPEKTLFLLAILGGGIGGTLGMWHFRHKTKHWYFRFGFPLIAILQLVAVLWVNIDKNKF